MSWLIIIRLISSLLAAQAGSWGSWVLIAKCPSVRRLNSKLLGANSQAVGRAGRLLAEGGAGR